MRQAYPALRARRCFAPGGSARGRPTWAGRRAQRTALGSTAGGLLVLLLPLLGSIRCLPVAQAEEVPSPAVVLRSGHQIQGRVVGRETVRAGTLLRVETDLGVVLVPDSEVATTRPPGTLEEGATFQARSVRISRLDGLVERQRVQGGEWTRIDWTDGYGREIPNAPDALVRPGDRVRTGPDGEVDLSLHRDVWIRLLRDSEIQLPATRAPATLALLRGRTLNEVTGRPRGETFRVQTPSAVLGVKGTAFAVDVGEREQVLVREGEVLVGERGAVLAGQRGGWTSQPGLDVSDLTPAERDAITVQPVRLPFDEWVMIPGGTYEVGWPELQVRDRSDGVPLVAPGGEPNWEAVAALTTIPVRKRMQLPPYLIQRREVTHRQFAVFARGVLELRWPGWPRVWGSPVGTVGSRFPEDVDSAASGIAWEAAQAYASWLGGRLPRESEWEVAGRGTSRSVRPWGRAWAAVHQALPWTDGFRVRGRPGGELPAVTARTVDVSPFGVEALVSGAAEWCLDVWVDPQQAEGRGRYDGPSLWPTGEPNMWRSDQGGRLRPMRVVRGLYLSLALDTGEPQTGFFKSGVPDPEAPAPGFRCVIPLE